MSDQSDDNSQDNFKDDSAKPMSGSSELVASGAAHREFGDDGLPGNTQPPRQITLKRLSACSSWDGEFGDAGRERMSDDRLLRGEAKPMPGPNTFRGALPWFAMAAIAAAVGALSGAAATFGVAHLATNDQAATTIDDKIARFNADLAAVKTNIETSTKTSTARLAKMSEALDKIKPPAPEITGSIMPPPAPVPPVSAPVAPQFSRLPVLQDWVLREVGDGGATIEGRQGIFEVFAGDPLPGVGRIDAIRRQDGRWVVVTSRGLIVAR